ncbi:MAG: glycosyltransferase [Lentisphaerae bacterium]|nr:glycosyltransferase [Lentisphaerota bacterium]
MIRVDMHVHSRYSRHPSEWFLQRIGAQESYTDVEDVYRMAKARGMTYVTLTDHNTIDGALELHARHPEDTFISSEVTAYFPEDGCKVHVLTYGITPPQFEVIQALREDIRQLRNYLRDQHIACSVAHATYPVNDRLSIHTIEKLLLLFDVFEGINGGRNRAHNETWRTALRSLTPARLDRLRDRHGIDPWAPDPWIKGVTGGSDDHAGLFVGQTFTLSEETATIPGFLDRVRQRRTDADGRHADHKSLSCAVYKIAYQYSQARTTAVSPSPLALFHALIFRNGRLGLKNWLAVQKLKRGKRAGDRAMLQCVEELLDEPNHAPLDSEAQIARMYNALTRLSDAFFSLIAGSLEKDLQNGNTGGLLGNLSAALPAMFLLAPAITVLRHMHGDRELLRGVAHAFDARPDRPRRLLWFTDTVAELNGVAVTMREIAARAHASGRAVKLVTCLADHEDRAALPPGVLLLPCIYHVTPGFYSAWTLRLPSLLRAMDAIAAEDPDEIVISTPGPVGLVGVAAARLLRIRCTGVYHTDFTRQADQFIGDHWVSSVVETYTRGFFTLMDEVRVPTVRYMSMLEERGLDMSKMKLFSRGIEPEFAICDERRQAEWRERLSIPPGAPVLLWAGRLGREKNLDFLFRVYHAVALRRPDARLVLAGDGPETERLRAEYRAEPRIAFTRRLDRADLPHLYGMADAFVFPSTTDTFGMVVLEAQACGLPAVVSDVGGPQELVDSGKTGFVVRADDLDAWTAAVLALLDMKSSDPALLEHMRVAARVRAQNGYGWDRLLDEMTGAQSPPPADAAPLPASTSAIDGTASALRRLRRAGAIPA